MKWRQAVSSSKSKIAVRGDSKANWMWVTENSEAIDGPSGKELSSEDRDSYDDWRPTNQRDDAVTRLGELA